jgi:ATP-dependent Lhr-like helicase
VVVRDDETRWWTWAGGAANLSLTAALPDVVDPVQPLVDAWVRLRPGTTPAELTAAVEAARGLGGIPAPAAADEAVEGLKFAEALPPELARTIVSVRQGDPAGAAAVLAAERRWFGR